MTALLLNLLDLTLLGLYLMFAWTSSTIFLTKLRGARASDRTYRWWARSKWPALTFVLSAPAITLTLDGHLSGWDAINLTWFAVFWWAFRNIGDDHITRRRKHQFAVKIEELHGRLVVVPA